MSAQRCEWGRPHLDPDACAEPPTAWVHIDAPNGVSYHYRFCAEHIETARRSCDPACQLYVGPIGGSA